MYTATYSPEDNKLRLYTNTNERLPKSLYSQVRSHGFIWAPRQELFVTPAWTPEREDFLLELCGQIDDEDKSLVERAQERAERFGQYSERSKVDAERAHNAVSAITDNIPLGLPIIVGHHSEKRARKDAEKITHGMARAVQLWDTAAYWKPRAAGAIRHAKYKERPPVRYRRIKTLETDKRREERNQAEAEKFLKLWQRDDVPLTQERAMGIANHDHISVCFTKDKYPKSAYEGSQSIWGALDKGVITPAEARELSVPVHQRQIAHALRWLAHITNRIEYERAMLDEQGGLKAEKFDIQPGGMVLLPGGEWVTVIRVNKSGSQVTSVTTNARFVRVRKIEEIQDYRPPTEERANAVKTATKQAPLCNYPGEDFRHVTHQEVKKRYSHIREIKANERYATHRCYHTIKGGSGLDCHNMIPVYITDKKRKDPPPATKAAEPTPALPTERVLPQPTSKTTKPPEPDTQAASFERVRAALQTGIKVVNAPQLFPTSPDLAQRMVELARIEPHHSLLEPSAGTGGILKQLPSALVRVIAIEINASLVANLKTAFPKIDVRQSDFLLCNGNLGSFDRILMNPPFINGEDIKHILHAKGLLNPNGLLVSLCANGPRQQEILKPLASYWEDLPPGSFSDQGTNVNVALLIIESTQSEQNSQKLQGSLSSQSSQISLLF
jgi:hypothetical protein